MGANLGGSGRKEDVGANWVTARMATGSVGAAKPAEFGGRVGEILKWVGVCVCVCEVFVSKEGRGSDVCRGLIEASDGKYS